MARFEKKNYLNRIMWSFVVIFVLAFITLIFIPAPMGDGFKKGRIRRIALNTAITVAARIAQYNTEDSTKTFSGIKTDFSCFLKFDQKDSLQLPVDYNCFILDSVVVVQHIDGASEEFRWR